MQLVEVFVLYLQKVELHYHKSNIILTGLKLFFVKHTLRNYSIYLAGHMKVPAYDSFHHFLGTELFGT